METLKETLGKYGKVVECSGDDELFTVEINTNSENGANESFVCIGIINDAVGTKYPMLKSCQINKTKFKYVLKSV